MRVVVSGASGLIGTALKESLTADGHDVVSLVRRPAKGPSESMWDPTQWQLDRNLIASADVVVNLAGASIGAKRLTDAYKAEVRQSRVDATTCLGEAIAKTNPSATLIQGSAMGFYGDRGDTPLQERTEGDASDFLGSVVRDWEAAATEAQEAGARVVFLRMGLVLAPHGGFASRLLPLVRAGLLKSLGDKEALQSWIALPDVVGGIRFLIDSDHHGPANIVAQAPATMDQIIAALATAMGTRPLFRVPTWALHAAVGEAADDLLASQRGVPGVLTRLGFEWSLPSLADAARYVVEAGSSKAGPPTAGPSGSGTASSS